jgi:hypothetical protein
MMDNLDDLDVFACHKVKIGDKERYVDCLRTYDEPIDKCPFCAAGIPVKPVRFVIMYQHDDSKVKIWERGKNFIAKLQSLCNRYQPLSEYVFEIERNGKAGDMATRYEIFPMDRVDPVDLTEIEKPELLGGLILEKNGEEMDVYLDTGNFLQQKTQHLQRRSLQDAVLLQQDELKNLLLHLVVEYLVEVHLLRRKQNLLHLQEVLQEVVVEERTRRFSKWLDCSRVYLHEQPDSLIPLLFPKPLSQEL